ncbi:Alpha/Beta hydrolase protein [Aspergillus karnatakaensis]|uniref:alpha/beta fold hydrolase n=1 Tax=Aspergillus karnatakaensis TaxID=1810916 RepID=UPI003CCD4C6A
MDRLARKQATTSRGYTYTYYHLPQSLDTRTSTNAQIPKPTLLLLHGFPDTHALWSRLLPSLLPTGYPLLIPDLLGYGDTSKPLTPEAYNSKSMATDLINILDHENITKIIPIGHDWGSYMAQRMYLWYPERVAGLGMLNIAYDPPAPFDLGAANATLEKATGLPRLAYWEFFSDPNCAEILERNLDSWFEALHGSPENWLERLFCHRGALVGFVGGGERVPVHTYAEALRGEWKDIFEQSGFAGPLNWYLVKVLGQQWEVEKELPRERYVVTVPTLFVGASRDTVCTTDAIEIPRKQGLLPELAVREVDSGHWPVLEAPEETGEVIVAWLREREEGFLS